MSAAAPGRVSGLRLLARLVLLVLLCLLPIAGVEVFTRFELRSREQAYLHDAAMQQAELTGGNLAEIAEGARQLLVGLSQLTTVRALDPACSEQLGTTQARLPAYRFLALVDGDGRLICASAPDRSLPPGVTSLWLRDAVAAPGFSVGRYQASPGDPAGLLPFFLRLSEQDPASAVVVAALDISWLASKAAEWGEHSGAAKADGPLIVADRGGSVIYRSPEPQRWIGQPLPHDLAVLAQAARPGLAEATADDGEARPFAYVPAAQSPQGFFVASGVDLGADILGLDGASWRDGLLTAGAAALALILSALLGWGAVAEPTRRLIAAAQRWREGDLTVRATVSRRRSEFDELGICFNEMAALLQARDAERAHLAQLLEARVAERTRALSETNNRLQVEIAERERTEMALHQAQKLQAVGKLAGGLAHDFNNMLATVLGNLELMERRLAPKDERFRPWIERAIGAVQRGAQLTSRLLAFSRRQRLGVGPTDINRLISDLATLAVSMLGHRVRITTELATDLSLALVDRSQVETAIINLALNAREAMPDGGALTIATADEVVVSGSSHEDPEPGLYVRVTLTDTGVGMSPEILARAFEPFFTTKAPNGSGLGLSQVYGMVRQSGGTVRMRSEVGVGTEVSLLLPTVQQGAATAPDAATALEPDQKIPRLVLLVDDDPMVRQVTAEMLKDLGCRVVEAASGADALVVLESQGPTFDVLILDYAMPGMTGLQLATAVRARGMAMPIVLATGYAELADPSEGSERIWAAILRKPFSLRELQLTLAPLPSAAAEASNRAPA